MKYKTTIANSIDIAQKKSHFDCACKKLLSEKIILAWIMKSTMSEYKDCNVEEIACKYIIGTPQIGTAAVEPDTSNLSLIGNTGVEDVTVTEGTVTFDIKFAALLPGKNDAIGLIINIEAQNDFYPGYPIPKRGIYYCSRMISSQYGTEFTHSHYENIKKVYSVWICVNPPKYRENTITEYCITENNVVGRVKEKKDNYDLMSLIMICLGKSDTTQKGSILELLNTLLSTTTDAITKKEILTEQFNIPMTQSFEGSVDNMCNLSEGVWQEGIAFGIQQGINEGISQGIVTSIRNLMDSMKLTEEQAMDALNVVADERDMYREMLRR